MIHVKNMLRTLIMLRLLSNTGTKRRSLAPSAAQVSSRKQQITILSLGGLS